jgi:hypothetical protein
MTLPPEFTYALLNVLTGQIDDLEKTRIALGNRERILVTPADELDKDGIARGFGIPGDDMAILGPIRAVVVGLQELEAISVKEVERYMRNSPWRSWLDSPASRGVGAKQLARLLGAIGDPYWHTGENRPRTVSQLWSYSGLAVRDGQAPRRKRGEKSNWSENARKRTWLIANSCIKTTGPFRDIYDMARDRYEDAVHEYECIRCGPAGKPAQIGSPLSNGHRHARGLRAVGKAVQKAIWRESRRHHGVVGDEDGLGMRVVEIDRLAG